MKGFNIDKEGNILSLAQDWDATTSEVKEVEVESEDKGKVKKLLQSVEVKVPQPENTAYLSDAEYRKVIKGMRAPAQERLTYTLKDNQIASEFPDQYARKYYEKIIKPAKEARDKALA